jgi:hypothetical protein
VLAAAVLAALAASAILAVANAPGAAGTAPAPAKVVPISRDVSEVPSSAPGH